jgi:hypothetical protein
MIGKVFGGGGSGDRKDAQLPKDIKDAISKCREAVQKGLEDRISRMVSWHLCSYDIALLL